MKYGWKWLKAWDRACDELMPKYRAMTTKNRAWVHGCLFGFTEGYLIMLLLMFICYLGILDIYPGLLWMIVFLAPVCIVSLLFMFHHKRYTERLHQELNMKIEEYLKGNRRGE